MRSYAKNFMYKSTVTYKQRQERVATEWDIRLDVSDVLPVERIISNIKENLDDVAYTLVSGVERPDHELGGCLDPARGHGQTGTKSPTTSTEHHVHVCLVLFVPVNRSRVLKLVRGPRKLGDEYAAPRNPKFTYAGWVIHHGKPGFKLDNEPLVRYEFGVLPMDAFTTDNALKIQGLLKKWGTDGTHARFKGYTDLIKKNKIKEKIEQLQMSLEDHDC